MMAGELRIPSKLLSSALAERKIKALRLFATAKLQGHRAEIAALFKSLKIHPKTGFRLVIKIVADGWAGTDGEFLFPRAWRELSYRKRGGLYITTAPKDIKKFEALCFAMGLKRVYRKGGGPRSMKGRALQEDFPTRYLSEALGISERRFERLKAAARRYKFIAVEPQGFTVVGDFREIPALRKHMKLPVFRRGTNAVVPELSKIRVLV
jgi:hypothetical protein